MIKIDVEGAEASVFQGATQLIQQTRPLILVESFKTTKLAALQLLGYKIYSLNKSYNYLLAPPWFVMAF
jgi:hypothetical protein